MADHLKLSADDRYALVDMHSPDELFPHPFKLANFAYAADQLRINWDFMWDFRQTQDRLYEDVRDAYEEAESAIESSRVIATKDNMEMVADLTRSRKQVVVMGENKLTAHQLDVSIFDEDYLNFIDLIDFTRAVPENDEYLQDDHDDQMERIWAEMLGARAQHLNRFLRSIASTSTMVEVMLQCEGEDVVVVPYHAHSLHRVETASELTLIRPARRSARYYQTFSRDIKSLEGMLNAPNVRERDIELLLRSNPLFLQGLNYREVYPQVVLPRPGAKDLRPDLICEPFDSDWCDIVELKLPTEKVIVGKENRAQLAACIHSATRQLREYSAYFDDRQLARQIEKKYGIKCHRPRLVVIIGRDPRGYDEEEQRRAMTTYPDLEVVTYDRLLKASLKRPLW